MSGGIIMNSYGLLFMIAIGCFGIALVCFSMISGDGDPMQETEKPEPRLYEGQTPQYDVEVEPGTYQYNPITGKTNIPENEFDLYMLYTIDNLPRGQQLQLNDLDLKATKKLKSPEGHWRMFPEAVQQMPILWTITGHGLVLLRVK